MNAISELELRKTVEERLSAAGLMPFFDRKRSQFLDVETHIFAEVVLTDASRLGDAFQILDSLKQELLAKGATLEYIARAIWTITPETVRSVPTDARGRFRAGQVFQAHLKSGITETVVTVTVTESALDFLAERFGFTEKSSLHQPGFQEIITGVVISFLQQELSRGGLSYWDPINYGSLELNDAAASYLLGHSAALMELLDAVNDAFHPLAVRQFLKSLAMVGIKAKHFEAVLPEFSNFLGGAFSRGQVFSISASELYSSLKPAEREILKLYYLRKLEALRSNSPELERDFPTTFE